MMPYACALLSSARPAAETKHESLTRTRLSVSLDQTLALSIRADVPLIDQADDSFIFRTVEVGPITFTALSPGLKAAFKQLAAGGVTEQQLSAIVLQAGEPSALML